MKIVAATKNKGKIKEIKSILSDIPCEILSMEDMGIEVEVDEDSDTFSGNAKKKSSEIMKICNEITIADDSGLVVSALNGEPGVFSARYAGEHGNDLKNNLLLLENMKEKKNREAKFVCAISASFPDGREFCVTGEMYGEIGYEMKGSGGFGYDKVFYLPKYKKTVAELDEGEKNKISHRAAALKLFKEKLKEFLKD